MVSIILITCEYIISLLLVENHTPFIDQQNSDLFVFFADSTAKRWMNSGCENIWSPFIDARAPERPKHTTRITDYLFATMWINIVTSSGNIFISVEFVRTSCFLSIFFIWEIYNWITLTITGQYIKHNLPPFEFLVPSVNSNPIWFSSNRYTSAIYFRSAGRCLRLESPGTCLTNDLWADSWKVVKHHAALISTHCGIVIRM